MRQLIKPSPIGLPSKNLGLQKPNRLQRQRIWQSLNPSKTRFSKNSSVAVRRYQRSSAASRPSWIPSLRSQGPSLLPLTILDRDLWSPMVPDPPSHNRRQPQRLPVVRLRRFPRKHQSPPRGTRSPSSSKSRLGCSEGSTLQPSKTSCRIENPGKSGWLHLGSFMVGSETITNVKNR